MIERRLAEKAMRPALAQGCWLPRLRVQAKKGVKFKEGHEFEEPALPLLFDWKLLSSRWNKGFLWLASSFSKVGIGRLDALRTETQKDKYAGFAGLSFLSRDVVHQAKSFSSLSLLLRE